MSRKNPKAPNYLSNKDILPEIMKFKETGEASELFGKMLLTLATQLSNHFRFNQYNIETKEEMIGEAILTCLKYCKTFDPNKQKYPNPFAYLTQIMMNAFKAYLNKYYNHVNIRQELFDNQFELDI